MYFQLAPARGQRSVAAMDDAPPPPVRIKDLARTLGVSEVTISLALRNHPRISVARRRQVQDTARRLGYRPNAMAAALAHAKWHGTQPPIQACIAWINRWPDPAQLRAFGEFDGYWKGAEAAAARSGYRLEEFRWNEANPLPRLVRALNTRGVTGLLIPPTPPRPDWGDFPWADFTTVRFGHSVPVPRTHLVGTDQLADGRTAFEQIAARGYQRIGLVAAAAIHPRFTAGYLLGQLEHPAHPALRPLFVEHEPTVRDQTRLAAWLDRQRPDALLTNVRELRELLARIGRRVPRDVALASLSVRDGHVSAGLDQHPEEIGKVAVQLLVSLLHHNERGLPALPREVLIEGDWVDGDSLPLRRGAARRPLQPAAAPPYSPPSSHGARRRPAQRRSKEQRNHEADV